MSMAAGVPASMGRRLLAALVDGALVLLVAGVPSVVAVGPLLADPDARPAVGWLAVGCGLLLVLAVTQWVLLGRRGWTLGKRAVGVRVVSERSGFPPGLGAAFLRLLVPVLANVVPVLGPVLVHLSPYLDATGRRQGWHDTAAGTLVVDGRPDAPGVAQVERRLQHLLTPAAAAPAPAPARSATAAASPEPGETAVPRTAAEDPAGGRAPTSHVPGRDLPPSRGLVAGTRVVPLADVLGAVPFPPQQREDEDVEATRLRPARARVPELAARDREVTVELTDGQRVTFSGVALIGRNPTPRPGEDGCRLIRVADPGRSVSKTHLCLGVDRNGLWVRDRHSTNGTVVTLADGQQILCGADQQVRLPPGASVAFGDYGLSVATVDAV